MADRLTLVILWRVRIGEMDMLMRQYLASWRIYLMSSTFIVWSQNVMWKMSLRGSCLRSLGFGASHIWSRISFLKVHMEVNITMPCSGGNGRNTILYSVTKRNLSSHASPSHEVR